MKYDQVYVFVDLPDEQDPVLAGFLESDGTNGRFVYGKSYLSRPDAYAFDPINLPLVATEIRVTGNQGVPAALLDAGPDNWGRRIMHLLRKHPPKNKIDELIYTRGAGVGPLQFSLSRSMPKPRPNYPALSDLYAIQGDIASIISTGALPIALERLFEPGSAMGGARPKAVVQDEYGQLWIAKFNRNDDLFDQAKAEQMCYLMMRDANIKVANSRLETIADRSVILVERFDQHRNTCRKHFISAHALIYQRKVKETEAQFVFSYPKIADIINRICTESHENLHELYRRMVFNTLIGNTDDHMRNHGFLKGSRDNTYMLSPAYDVVPQPTQLDLQAIGLGTDGRFATFANLMSAYHRFGLKENQARETITSILEITSSWQKYANCVGLNQSDQTVIANCFNHDRLGNIEVTDPLELGKHHSSSKKLIN